MSERILVSDVGSTTTKLLLLEHSGGEFRALGSVAVGTTVEKPSEDVCIGFFAGVEKLSEITGIRLLDENGTLTVKYHTTSSAGGGLQIMVVALASADSGTMARATAFSAGGVVIDSFAIDDETPRVEKIRRMLHLSPDLVIMAGGYENGAIAGVVNMAQLIALSRPQPKYGSGKLPLVFCGNTQARPFIHGMLGDLFSITYAENIRPDGLRFNLRPAIEEVHRLFMNHVMQMAPGYARLSAMTSAPILPTPAGVERILELYSKNIQGNVVMADMGGATTDIFSNVRGQFQRTVAANTGMSYSLSNILREAEPENVFRHLPGMDQGTARNWILAKTLFPTINPECETAKAVEGAAAAEGMNLAWRHHLDISYRRARVGCTERLRRLGKCKFEEAFRTVHGDPFKISDIKVIIGAGGIMAHSTPRRAAWILISGFRPKGFTLLMVDRYFQSPHMGVLSVKYPEEALKYYGEECLVPVGRVYAPISKVRKLKVETHSGMVTVESGGFLYLESSRGVTIPDVPVPDDDIPIIVDLRFGDELLPMDFMEIATIHDDKVALPYAMTPIPETEHLERSFSLSYAGEIAVKEADSVSPGDVIGENKLVPPRVFFVDVRGRVGYQRQEITDEMVMEHILVSAGDKVKTGDRIFKLKTGSGLTSTDNIVDSPVRGVVTSVVPPGLVIMREIQDYDGKPHFVNVARLLGVKPRRIIANLKVQRGEFVQRGQVIAVGDKLSNVKSPATGTVLDIDKKTGVVKIQYVLEPVRMHSPISGRVTAVDPKISVTIGSTGAVVQGTAAFGATRWGELAVGEPRCGCIMLLRSTLTSSYIDSAVDAGVSGIVAPSVSAADLVSFLGEEPGVILTGDEDIPFSLMLLRGVGDVELEDGVYNAMASCAGGNCALFTTTRLRAGVERPFLLLQDCEV